MKGIHTTSIIYLLALSYTSLALKDNGSPAADTSCESPKTPKNGNILGIKDRKDHNVPHKTRISYSCDYGFRLIGRSSNKCVRGSWQFDVPLCEVIRCPDPGTPENGWRNGNSFEVGSKVSYSCFAGYTLIGSFERYCLPNGQWSGVLTRCNSESNYCPDPGVPINGMKTGSRYDEGSTVHFQCYPGYTLIGSRSRVCQYDRTWTGTEPKCQGLHDFDSNEDLSKRLKVVLKTTAEFQKIHPARPPLPPEQAGHPVQPGAPGMFPGEKGEFPVPPRFPEIKGERPQRPGFPGAPGFPGLPGMPDRPEAPRFPGRKGERPQRPGFPGAPGFPGLPGMPDRPEAPRFPDRKGERPQIPGFPGAPGFPGLPGMPDRPEAPRFPERKGESPQETFFYVLPDHIELPERPRFPGLPDLLERPSLSGGGVPGLRDLSESPTSPGSLGVPQIPTMVPLPEPPGIPGQFDLPEDISNVHLFKNPDDPRRVIIYFLFDSSGSVGRNHFRMCIAFAAALVRKVKISRNGNRVGALSFSSKSKVHFMPHQFSRTADVVAALKRIRYSSGGTSMTSALETVLNSMIPYTVENLGTNTKSIIFIFTDGKPNMRGDPMQAAEELKSAGIEIYCIGITGNTQKNILYKTASEPQEKHVFMLNNYSQMPWLIQEITTETKNYYQCGLGLDDVANQYAEARGPDSAKQAAQPWPWMAALYVSNSIYEIPTEMKCGGSIIGEQWILTAAHCLVNPKDGNKVRDPRTFIIKLGLTNVKNESSIFKFSPEKLITHPKYDPDTLDYDVALIKLDGLIEYKENIRPICLPKTDLPNNTFLYKDQHYGLVTGWGYDKQKTARGMTMSRMKNVDHLKELRLTIQSRDRCQQSLGSTEFIFTPRMYCAGSQISEVDTCQGDSGGPMMQSQLNREGIIYWVQVGIVSWGIGCQLPNTYGFYTHVHNLRNWITETIETN